MHTHRIPDTDLTVSALCFGAGGFGTAVRGADLDRLVGAFLDAGGRFFDTAHCYAFWMPDGLGASERELGNALRRAGALGRVVVATKGGHPDCGEGYRRPADFLSPAVLLTDIEESRERLGVECIDLYFLHRDDGRTPAGEIIERLNVHVREGRLRYLGASNWSVERIAAANEYARAHSLQGFVMSQVQWSLAVPNWQPAAADPTMRFVTDQDLAWHRASGIPIACYAATAGGYFAGNPQNGGGYDNPVSRGRHERATALARELGCTPTQVAFAYLMSRTDPPALPLFSTTRLDHLEEILGAAAVTLSADQVAWLRDGPEA